MAASGSIKKIDPPEPNETLDPIIFLEFHMLKKFFMPEFLELLKNKGYKAFLFESSSKKTISNRIDDYNKWLKQKTQLTEGLPILLQLAVSAPEKRAILSLFSDNPSNLMPDEDPHMFSDDRWIKRIMALPTPAEISTAGYYFTMAVEMRCAIVNLAIFEKIQSLNFEYHAIDMDYPRAKIYGDGTEYESQAARNAHMAKQIDILSQKYNGGVIGLIGAFHFPVQNILAESTWAYGPRSHWFFINPGKPTILEPASGDKFELPKDQQRLLSNCAYGLHIIDSLADAKSYLRILGKKVRRPDIFTESHEKLSQHETKQRKEIWSISISVEKFDNWIKKYAGHNDTHNEKLVDWLSEDGGAEHVQNYKQFCELATALKTKGYSTIPPPSKSEFNQGVSKYNERVKSSPRY